MKFNLFDISKNKDFGIGDYTIGIGFYSIKMIRIGFETGFLWEGGISFKLDITFLCFWVTFVVYKNT